MRRCSVEIRKKQKAHYPYNTYHTRDSGYAANYHQSIYNFPADFSFDYLWISHISGNQNDIF